MSELGNESSTEKFEDDDWTAVQVGPTVVGWVGPTLASQPRRGHEPNITVRMGDREYRMSVGDFESDFISGGTLPQQGLKQIEEEFNEMNMLGYRKYFAIPVPVGSLDITSSGMIEYTVRSGETLMAALKNFFNALAVEVQADLHTKTPVEVVRKFAELISCNYPILDNNLTWRGMLLNDVPQQRTTMKVKVIRQPFLNARYDGFFEVQELASTHISESLRAGEFGSFVDWQVRSEIKSSRDYPKDVIHIRAASREEYVLAEQLFRNGRFLAQYYISNSIEPLDASFFLSMAGDPLEEWLDGKTISMDEFLMGIFQTKKSLQLSGYGVVG